MPEWNQSPGGSPPSLDDVLERIRLKFEGFKGGPVLILAAVLGVVIVLWTAWFTVQPEETGIVQRFGKVMRRPWLRFHEALHHRQETPGVKAVCGSK